ncbi:MAG: hypothetical protein ACLFQK_11385, partial [Fibrobacterota bacterium]
MDFNKFFRLTNAAQNPEVFISRCIDKEIKIPEDLIISEISRNLNMILSGYLESAPLNRHIYSYLALLFRNCGFNNSINTQLSDMAGRISKFNYAEWVPEFIC